MLALGEWRPKLVLFLLLLFPFQTPAEIKSWRVGDQDHPWNLIPVSGRLTWGRGWAVEILTDDDGAGLIDEDPIEAFDSDLDGRIDEDGPDPQFDSDGDGKLNEDGLMTDGDDDYDGRTNEAPYNGTDDDGDGLIDEDGRRLRDTGGVATWLRPIELNERYLQGEFGGVGPDGK